MVGIGQQLGLGELSEPQATALRAVRPTRPEVAQTYAQGRELLRRFAEGDPDAEVRDAARSWLRQLDGAGPG